MMPRKWSHSVDPLKSPDPKWAFRLHSLLGEPRSKPMPAPDAAQPHNSRFFRVLIVEDDEDSREMLGELVSLLGHSPVRAADAIEALQCVRDAEPDVALIDIGLPEIDGCEVARRVRASGASKVRLIALTGYSDGATRESATAAGFDDFVVKPLLPETLEHVLRRVTPGALPQ